MGTSSSRRTSPQMPIPQYPPPYNPSLPYGGPPMIPPYNTGVGNVSPPLSRKQRQKLDEAYRTIQSLQGRMPPMQPGTGMAPPRPSSPNYSGPPLMNLSQVSPALQRAYGQYPSGALGYRDSDYGAVANIAGLNPADVAILHKEYVNLTRGGRNKLDRVVFRQLLRDVLIDANNENIDRAIENIFVSIDRNRDGFIDFPEFVGAFRDVLRGDPNDPQSYLIPPGLPDYINEPVRTNIVNAPFVCQPAPQLISMPSASIQQSPLVCSSSTAPLLFSFDSNQSPCVASMQGQQMIGQPTALQCLPMPI
ncbi:unnamed protein product [Rotaria sordida]|uniref:EF-hand domain-containing protein n=1 Tax=Rotaria sordida TaxID=392033 RepID=A0A819BRR2_9BILA|nr:unnamed protein product [Rotaria sordida]CAF3806292.1 unnamed protein product [Rotaria sordida]